MYRKEERDFEIFRAKNPSYSGIVKKQMSIIYKTYSLLCEKRFNKLSRNAACFEMAQKIGFGMLLRHSLEAVSVCVSSECGINFGEATVYERLSAAKGKSLYGYSAKKEKILFDALELTNEIAHPNVLSAENVTFKKMKYFYNTAFKKMLEDHILQTDKTKVRGFAAFKEANRLKRRTNRYLKRLKILLDNFDIAEKITFTLIRGCLVRHLTECAVNLWCYNSGIIPTDSSNSDNRISLGGNLSALAQKAKENKKTGDGAPSFQIISNLYKLKNTSNGLMHVEEFKISKILKAKRRLTRLHLAVVSECSPRVLERKLSASPVKAQIIFKPAIITTLLCGFAGWLGAHHFYCGNIARGTGFLLINVLPICKKLGLFAEALAQLTVEVNFIFSLVCFICSAAPIISLYALLSGRFKSAKWGALPKAFLTDALSVLFIIIHVVLLFIS